MSYTHKEFRYAVSKNIPVIVLLNGARGKIPADKTEATVAGKKRLEDFISEASNGRTRKTWVTIGDLQSGVLAALIHAKQTKPAIGWLRGDAVASADALEELAEVRRENARYLDTIGHLEVELALPPIPAADEKIQIELLPTSQSNYSGTYARLECTWIGAFPIFFSNLQWGWSDWQGVSTRLIHPNRRERLRAPESAVDSSC